MEQVRWEVAQACSDHLSAEVIAAVLRDGAVPARIVDAGALPGLDFGSRVLVPGELLHRARWVLAQRTVTDAELEHLAAGSSEADKP